ncbi:hypothetical protein H4R19_002076 [Coemansia spiralis]|nr:hypothetical protein H4R19_002076 [Coemansia spiralis]
MNRVFSVGARAAVARTQPALAARLTASRFASQYKKKYYLDPEPQIGDYPNLPQKFAEERPQLGWWDRQNRRNFGEPIPEQDEILNMMAPTQYKSPGWKQVGKMWAGVIIAIGSVYYLIANVRPQRPYMRSFYPNGLKDELGGIPARTLADAIKEASS